MIVDTCVWIDFFNGRDTAEIRHLQGVLNVEPEQIFICDIVYLELLSGFHLNQYKLFEQAKEYLDCFEILNLKDKPSAIQIIRKLREKGITIKGFQNGLLDVVIGQIAIDNKQTLLTCNRSDFEKIAGVTNLILEEVST